MGCVTHDHWRQAAEALGPRIRERAKRGSECLAVGSNMRSEKIQIKDVDSDVVYASTQIAIFIRTCSRKAKQVPFSYGFLNLNLIPEYKANLVPELDK
eukprot:SAG11_NODE_1074_length_5968_cov_2.041063_1_plen_98_part_00